METVIRAASVYVIVWLIFRVAGRRTFAEMTTFDFVLLLIISECCTQALMGEDYSVTGAFVAVATLVVIDIALSLVKRSAPTFEKYLDGLPYVIVENGKP